MFALERFIHHILYEVDSGTKHLNSSASTFCFLHIYLNPSLLLGAPKAADIMEALADDHNVCREIINF